MELILNVLAILEIIVFLRKILQVEFSKSKLRLILGIILLIVAIMIYTYCSGNISMIFGYLIGYTIGIALMLDEHLIKAILKKEFASIYVSFLYMPFELILIIVKNFIKVSWNQVWEDIMLSIVVIMLMYIVSSFLRRYRSVMLWIGEIPAVYYIVSIIYGMTTGLIITCIKLTVKLTGAAEIFIQIVIIILSIYMYVFGIGFALIDLWRKQYKRENALKDTYMRVLERHENERENHFREVRRMKHDMNTHIRMLNNMAKVSGVTGIQDYIADMTGHYDVTGHIYYNTGNVYTNSILAVEMYNEKDITFRCEGILPEDTVISQFALCTIFSNLLSNSIEACKRLKGAEKVIYIKMSVNGNVGWKLTFENPVEWNVDTNSFERQYTSKQDKDNHGFGLYNVRRVVEENGGILAFYNNKGMFGAEVAVKKFFSDA